MTARDLSREARIVSMRADGATLQEIADVFGMSRQRVHQLLDKAGAPRRDTKLAGTDWAAVYERYCAGATLQQLAEQMGCSRDAIQSQFVKRGYARRPRGRRPQQSQ